MCVHGNVSQKRCITAFILTSGFSASCVSSQCPPTSSHYSESLKWSAARLPLPADCIGLAGMIISALSKNSPFEAQMVPAESCTKLYQKHQASPCPTSHLPSCPGHLQLILTISQLGKETRRFSASPAVNLGFANSGCISSFQLFQPTYHTDYATTTQLSQDKIFLLKYMRQVLVGSYSAGEQNQGCCGIISQKSWEPQFYGEAKRQLPSSHARLQGARNLKNQSPDSRISAFTGPQCPKPSLGYPGSVALAGARPLGPFMKV